MHDQQENPQDGTPPEFMRIDASLNKDVYDPKIKNVQHQIENAQQQRNEALSLQGAVRTTKLH